MSEPIYGVRAKDYLRKAIRRKYLKKNPKLNGIIKYTKLLNLLIF